MVSRERKNELALDWYYKNHDANKKSRRKWRESNPASYLLSTAKARAGGKGIPLDIDLAWVKLYLEPGVCSVTDMPLDMTWHQGDTHSSPWRPSIDRIDGSKGYTKDNCRIVCWIYNVAKYEWTDDEVLTMAEALIGKRRHKCIV